MRPRSMVLPDSVLAPKQRGLASRFARATVFFLVGAISATELYPQMVVGRHAEDNRTFERTAARSATPDVTWDQTAAFLRDSAENTGGPIPPVSFAAQPAPAAKAKFARTKRSSPRRNGSAYQQEPSYWVTGRGSFASGGPQFGSDFGPRQSHGTQFDRRGPFAMWR
jgi:hypothetical protein